MTGKAFRKATFDKLWAKRDMRIQMLFDRIEKWLKRPDHIGQFNTEYYDSISKQWLEFATITDRQLVVLKNIIERWNME